MAWWRKLGPFGKKMVVVGIIEVIGFILLLYYITPAHPDLSHPPQESRRVKHPAGYSIIIPGNYVGRVNDNDIIGYDDIISSPQGGQTPNRPTFFVRRWVKRLKNSPTTFSSQPNQLFQGRPAVTTLETGTYDFWKASFERDGFLFDVILLIPAKDRGNDPMPPPA